LVFSRSPVDVGSEQLTRDEILDALRLAIMAELDAISLYLQIARRIQDPRLRRLFEDVAREEKTHMGEFLEALKMLDEELAKELVEGAEEARELLEG